MKKLSAVAVILLFFGMIIFPTCGIQIDNIPFIKTNPVNPTNGTFMKTFGGEYTDGGRYVHQTSDGGYIIVGYTNSFGAGESDVWLIKTQSNGIKKWDITFGGTEDDEGYCVQQTSDGGYIITGKTSGDVWLIKTDHTGNMVWDKTFGGKDSDIGYCVQQTSDGGYIIAGETNSFSAGYNDAWLIKTDSNGSMMWNKTFGGGGRDSAYSVQQTSDSGYIITGETYSYGASYNDVWLIKTDNNGNKEWDKTFDIIESETGRCVQQTNDGGYIITGETTKFSYKDVFLIKTDMNGSTEWNRRFGGVEYESGYFVQQTIDDGYIITGWKYIFIDYYLWLIKTDSNGKKMWEKTFSDRWGYCVQQTSDGGYIITGETNPFSGYEDVCLIKTDKDGKPRNKAFTSNMLLLRILERSPLLHRLIDIWRVNLL